MEKHFKTIDSTVWLPHRYAVGQTFYKFYEGLREKKILGNVCPECGKRWVPPKSFCPVCNTDIKDWIEVSQQGRIESWTLARREFYGQPVRPPFLAALIQLDGTDCRFLHLVHKPGLDLERAKDVSGAVSKGQRVQAVWKEKRQGHLLDINHFEILD